MSKNKPKQMYTPNYRLDNIGALSLSDAEMLSLVIGGRNAISQSNKLMSAVDNNLRTLGKLSTYEIIKIGMTKREATAVSALLEIGRRKELSDLPSVIKITSSKDVADIFRPILSDLVYEEFWILFLNRANKVMNKMKLSQGGVSGTVTDVRMVMKKAIEYLASGIIVCHNHPSGNLNPSESDNKITQKIKEAGKIMDIQLLDHLIISDKNYYSFADDGLI